MIHTILLVLPLSFAAPDPEWVAERDALVREATESELRAWEAGNDLGRRVLAMDVRTWQSDPSLAMLAWSAEPSPFRGRLLRFGDARLQEAAAAGPLVARLLYGQDAAPVRVALAGAITHTGPAWPPLVGSLLAVESDLMVRVMLVEGASHAPAAAVAGIVRLGFADAAGPVRAAAARSAAYATPPLAVGDLVVAALVDSDAEVRAEAARSLGFLDLDDAWTPLVVCLHDRDAGVRLQALRSLQKLDGERAAALPEVDSLRSDSDSRVQRAAMGSSGD